MQVVVYSEKDSARFINIDTGEVSVVKSLEQLKALIICPYIELFSTLNPKALNKTKHAVFLPIAIITHFNVINGIFLAEGAYSNKYSNASKDICVIRDLCADKIITEQQLNKRYMCYAIGSSCPQHIHKDSKTAFVEALRLSSVLKKDIVLYAEIFTFSINIEE